MPQSTATRPATDLVRSAVFSMLESMEADWSKALDLYAGSGAMGLEALSRGADWVDFVDHDRHCCITIKQNAEMLGFSEMCRVYCMKVPKALGLVEGPYGTVFLDPPYADESLPDVLSSISQSSLLAGDAIVIALHSARKPLESKHGTLVSIKERRHGDTSISLFRQEALT